MAAKRHVVRDDERWAVKAPGADRASSRHDERDGALRRAREIVSNEGGGSVVVHREDGQIENVESVEAGEFASAGDPDARRGGADLPPRDEDGRFVPEGEGRSSRDEPELPPRDEDGQFVSRDEDGSGREGTETPPRDEDGQFVSRDEGRSGRGESDLPPRDEDGRFVPEDEDGSARAGAHGTGHGGTGARVGDDVEDDDGRSLRDVARRFVERIRGGSRKGVEDESPTGSPHAGAPPARAGVQAPVRTGDGAIVRGTGEDGSDGVVHAPDARARPAPPALDARDVDDPRIDDPERPAGNGTDEVPGR